MIITMNNRLKTVLIFSIICLLCPAIASAQATKKKSSKKKSATATTKTKKPQVTVEPAQAEDLDKLDLMVRPKPLASTAFTFPEFEEFTLPNGLHVYVIENHAQPTLTLSIVLRTGEAYDPPGKEGTASVMGDLMQKGTKKRSAQQTAEALDGVGASTSVSSSGESTTISGSCIKKHTNLLLGIISEQILEPAFNDDELAKLRQQYQASIAARRARPMEIAQALSRKVAYGFDNPLARRTTEKTIASITRQDVVDYHKTFLRPNIASIALVGDVTVKEARDLIQKYFGKWETSSTPVKEIGQMQTAPAGVYFVPRKGSVQSTIVVTASGPGVREPDYHSASLTASYLGSGFGSMLFSTLRETYSYTYSPFSSLTRGHRYNRFAIGAEVRSSVTDSAIVVILQQIGKLISEGPEELALERRIASEVGQYRLAMESATTVAAILQNAWISGIPISEVAEHTQRLQNLGTSDVRESASQYLGMFNLRLVVVGSPEVRTKLEQFGPVKDFSLDLEPVAEQPLEPVDITPADLIAKHIEGLGGSAAVSAVTSVKSNATVSMVMQGKEMQGTFERILARPNKEYNTLDLGVMRQTQWVDGARAWVSMMGGPAGEQSVDESAKLALEARIFPLISLISDGYKVVVKGKRSGVVQINAVSPTGRDERYFLDESTMLITRIERDEQTGQGMITMIEKYEDYREAGGVRFPSTIRFQNPIYSMTMSLNYSVNPTVQEDVFTPPTK